MEALPDRCPEQGTSISYLSFFNALAFGLTARFRITINFKDSKGSLIKTVEANEGDDILSIAHEHDIDLEGEDCARLTVEISYSCHRFRPLNVYPRPPSF